MVSVRLQSRGLNHENKATVAITMPYLPPNSANLATERLNNRRLFVGLIGAPGTGKTWGALTFPNPYVVDFDGGLVRHYGKDIPTLRLYSVEECDRLKVPREIVNSRVPNSSAKTVLYNKRDFFYNWIKEEGPKFEEGQTLIIDSLSALEVAYNQWTDPEVHPRLSKKGEIDEFFFWTYKIDYFTNLMECFRGLRCSVVMTMHEANNVTDGQVVSSIQPILQTKFVAKLPSYFDEYIRCIARFPSETGNAQQNAQILRDIGPITQATYLWQIKPNDLFNAKSRCSRKETYVTAGYESLTY